MTNENLNTVLAIFSAPLTVMTTAAMYKLFAWLGISLTATDKQNMEHEAQIAVGAGLATVAKISPEIMRGGITTPQQLKDVTAAAADFFKARFPDRTAKIAAAAGVDTANGIDAAVQQSMAARLTNVIQPTALVAGAGGGPGGATT